MHSEKFTHILFAQKIDSDSRSCHVNQHPSARARDPRTHSRRCPPQRHRTSRAPLHLHHHEDPQTHPQRRCHLHQDGGPRNTT